MEQVVILALEVLGLLLVAAGAVAGAYLLVEWASLAVGGVVLLAGSQLAGHLGRGG